MPGACLNSWQTDECEWSIGHGWRSSDWIKRGIFVALALMLAYTLSFSSAFPAATTWPAVNLALWCMTPGVHFSEAKEPLLPI
jgi:hypothetical protein